jgi:hypothetical protein
MKEGDKVIINGETFYIYDAKDCGWFGGGHNRDNPDATFYQLLICKQLPFNCENKTKEGT